MSWRRTNLALTALWAVMIPVSVLTGWLWSIAFIAACSIYANLASHLAAWRADEPTKIEERHLTRLTNIENQLEEIIRWNSHLRT